MRIAILGATSALAKDLVLSFTAHDQHALTLFARRPEAVLDWLTSVGLAGQYESADFDAFGVNQDYQDFEAIINFVGVGNPAQAVLMGAAIFDVTLTYDALALDYLRRNPACRYIFLSSGAAYGSRFEQAVDRNTLASVAINNVQPQDWYAIAKLHAECRHRSLPELPIVDIRVFNYVSRTQDMSARFLISDVLRAIRDQSVLQTSPDYMVRDYLHPLDFHNLVGAILASPAANAVVDCYSLATIDKPALLAAMQEKFGLQYQIIEGSVSVNATGNKPHYYSKNTRAADFGYRPSFTSQDAIVIEMQAILDAAASPASAADQQ
jgi:nucleoside-diphosphate-sugar epimerase